MSGQWFVRRGGKVLGPVTAARLKALAGEGKLKPTDEVREGESDDWVRASALGWLFPTDASEDIPATDEQPVAGESLPAESAEPSEQVKDSTDKNAQKTLLVGGGILAAVMLMGCCVCGGVLSRVGGTGKTTAPSVEGGVDRERAKTLAKCGKSVLVEAKIGDSPAQIKSMMAVKARAAGIQGLKPTNEETVVVDGEPVLVIKYGSDVSFMFMNRVDRVRTMGLFGGVIDGEKFFPLGD